MFHVVTMFHSTFEMRKYYLGFSDLVKTVLGHESTAEPATDFQTTEFRIPSLKGNMNYYMSAILPLIY